MSEITITAVLDALEARQIRYQYKGTPTLVIRQPTSIDKLCDESISFIRGNDLGKYEQFLHCRNAVILHESYMKKTIPEGNYIFVDLPEIAFYIAAGLFQPTVVGGIHPAAVISSEANIGHKVTVGALSYIGPRVTLGNNVVIGVGCVINNASVGEDTVIQAGVTIGSDALGALKDQGGKWLDRPHFGRVDIGSYVRIEDNVVINRGYLRDTVISTNVRIGASTFLGNGVLVEEGVILAPSVFIAGSVRIGKNSSIWGNASIREGLSIGRGCVIGMGSVLLENAPDWQLWVGNPARFKKQLEEYKFTAG